MLIVFSEYSARGAKTFRRLLNYLLTYLLTPWSRVLLQKLTGPQLVKFPTFYWTRRFITAFQSVTTCPYPEPGRSSPYLHIPLPEDTFYYYPIYAWVSPVVSFPQIYPPKPCTRLSPPHMRYKPRPSHSPRFYHTQNIGWGTLNFILSPVTSSLLGKILSSTPYSQTPSAYVPPSMSATKFHTHTKQQGKLYFSKC